MSTPFDPTDPKYTEAADNLSLLTGIPWNLVKSARSNGDPVWVFRALTPAVYLPDYDLLHAAEGFVPLSPDPSDYLAIKMANFMLLTMDRVCNVHAQNNGFIHAFKLKAMPVPDFMGIKEGCFQGAIEVFAEAQGEAKGINYIALKTDADTIRYQMTLGKPYAPPEYGSGIARITEPGDLERINVRRAQWAERIAKLNHPNLEISPGKRKDAVLMQAMSKPVDSEKPTHQVTALKRGVEGIINAVKNGPSPKGRGED